MLLDKHERKYKRFVTLQKEYNNLLEAERKLPWTEVKPYQDGWFIHIEFRDEIKIRADYPHLQAVLSLVARRGRTRDPKLVNRLRSSRRLDSSYKLFGENARWFSGLEGTFRDQIVYHSNWKYGTVAPMLGRIREEEYKKLTADKQKWLMRFEDGKVSYFHAFNRVYYRAQFPDGFLRMKVRPAYVTHVKDIDSQLMKRKAEVDRELRFLGWDFYTNYSYGKYEHHFQIRRRRAHDRAVMRRLEKGEIEDFEHLRKNINYD